MKNLICSCVLCAFLSACQIYECPCEHGIGAAYIGKPAYLETKDQKPKRTGFCPCAELWKEDSTESTTVSNDMCRFDPMPVNDKMSPTEKLNRRP
ncbi:MAG: hypothetical protein LBP31_02515 [Holosporales bacterium]|nr:hypothetical protein [Holosporales bacterium]